MAKPSSSNSDYGSVFAWQPSRCSTDAPTSASNGGTYQTSNNYETQSLLDSNKPVSYEDVAARQKKRQFLRVAVITCLTVAIYCFLTRSSLFSQPDDSGVFDYDNDDALPAASSPDGKRRPLSTLHPVDDLGILPFARPENSRPSSVLTHNLTGGPKSAFPTNAWYQNMLLVPSGEEPTDIHRAYATPFLVDAVGPIPGLRVHANHIAASSSVIQLNSIDEYGLTVGAAPDATASAPSLMAVSSSDIPVTAVGNTTNSTESTNTTTSPHYSNVYSVENMTPLGLTLGWNKSFPMTSSIVKGMPYGTMKYDAIQTTSNGKTWYPTVASQIRLAKLPIVDGKTVLNCAGFTEIFSPTADSGGDANSNSTSGNSTTITSDNSTTTTTANSTDSTEEHRRMLLQSPDRIKVEREVELQFYDSDFAWLVFVSRPVTMQCVVDPKTHAMQLQVVDDDDFEVEADEDVSVANETHKSDDGQPFFIRIALSKVCATNKNPIYCHREEMMPHTLKLGQGRYDDLLRNHSHLIPGPDTSFDYQVDQARQQIQIVFDWDTRDVRNYAQPVKKVSPKHDLIVFALPHHLDLMGTSNAPGYLKYCANTLIGPACLLSGSQWTMAEHLPPIDFRAARPPAPWAIQSLAKAARSDIRYTIPKFYRRGAGDTYFSGKMIAKLGRILVITKELKDLCGQGTAGSDNVPKAYKEVCKGVKLPSDREIRAAVSTLRSSTEIWLNGKAVTPFVFDDAWGGVVSCGCDNPDGGDCQNKYPQCPSFTDPGLNFGNAFYNDLHFHYGYHIFAAAVVSSFDPDWGKKFFQRVLLLVRNIANPAESGDYFPAFRHKDWFQGHSWASGVVPPYKNGRNQESSSESIAAYESVALYGSVMMTIWDKESKHFEVAKDVHEAGLVATATELRSTRRYYHVRDQGNANEALKIYPSEYTNHAIGMMWNTMAQYQTWFGGKPYLAAGIQLLPITPVAELRDRVQWLSEMYPSFAETCSANPDCEENGWSVLQLTSLATIGHQKKAAKGAEALSPEVFTSAGGNGHSLTNTLWYIATRPEVDFPMDIGNSTVGNNTTEDDVHVLTNCLRPRACTDYVLDTIADEYSCRQRMTDLIDTMGHTQQEACFMVAKIQFPDQCGACNPNATEVKMSNATKAQCPPCTVDQCDSELNKCPEFRQTFVCTEGPNRGGCSRFPWDVRSSQCTECCELTECFKQHKVYADHW